MTYFSTLNLDIPTSSPQKNKIKTLYFKVTKKISFYFFLSPHKKKRRNKVFLLSLYYHRTRERESWKWIPFKSRCVGSAALATTSNFQTKREAAAMAMRQGALRGPSDYSQEPTRHPSLRINAKVPAVIAAARIASSSLSFYSYVLALSSFVAQVKCVFWGAMDACRSRSMRRRRGGTSWRPTSPPWISSSRGTMAPSPSSTTSTGTVLDLYFLSLPDLFLSPS